MFFFFGKDEAVQNIHMNEHTVSGHDLRVRL